MTTKSVSIKDQAMLDYLKDKDFSRYVRDLITADMKKEVKVETIVPVMETAI